MERIFLQLVNMSLSAGWIVLAVVLVRFLLKKMPKWLHCMLWSLVALRLVIPVFPESPFSILPSARVVPQDIAVSAVPAIHTGITAVNAAVNPTLTKTPAGELETLILVLTAVWLVGMAVMLGYGIYSYLRLQSKIKVSLCTQRGVYISDYVDTPFILGIFRPRIYLPSELSEEQQYHVLAHERAHLRRRDHWWKPIGYVLLAMHWFNPLLWLGYILLCRDIETACDEKVIRDMDSTAKKRYSEALLFCSVHRRNILVCPLAFGEVAVKERIKSVLNYKKPVFWALVAAIVICVAVAGCALTDPMPCVHAYKEEVTLAETCSVEGSRTLTCEKCWHGYLEAIPAHDHSYGESRMTKEPDCSHTGEMSADCVECKQTFVVEVLQTNGVHHMENTRLRAPTCTDPGEGVNTCTDCGYQETCTYALAAHDFKSGVTQPGNCTFPQQTQQICRSCGLYEWAVTGEKDAGNHLWSLNPAGTAKCTHCGLTKSGSYTGFTPSSQYSRNPDITDVTSPIGKKPSTTPELPVVQWDIYPRNSLLP